MEIIQKPIVTEKFNALASRTVKTGKRGNDKGRPDTRGSRNIAQFAFVVLLLPHLLISSSILKVTASSNFLRSSPTCRCTLSSRYTRVLRWM